MTKLNLFAPKTSGQRNRQFKTKVGGRNTSPVRDEPRTDIVSEHHTDAQLTYFFWVAPGTSESMCVTPGKHTKIDWGLNRSQLVTHTPHITFQAGLHIKSAHFIFRGREEFCASPWQHGSASDVCPAHEGHYKWRAWPRLLTCPQAHISQYHQSAAEPLPRKEKEKRKQAFSTCKCAENYLVLFLSLSHYFFLKL